MLKKGDEGRRDYTVQYCEMYKDRTKALGKEIEKHMSLLGYRRVMLLENEKESLLVGCLNISFQRKSVVKELYKVVEIDSVPIGIRYPSEYYLEAEGMERVHLSIPDEISETLVAGTVIGVIGKKIAGIFKVSKIIKPIDAHKNKSKEKNKKVQYDNNTCIIIPGVQEIPEEKIKQFKNTLDKYDTPSNIKIILFEGIYRKEKDLSEIVLEIGEEKISMIPGAGDCVPYMIPYADPSRVLLRVGNKCSILSSPCRVTLSGKDVIFCPYISIKPVAWCLQEKNNENNEKNEDNIEIGIEAYFDALSALITYKHISPMSPDMCPTYPSKNDLFILETIPDALIVRVKEPISGHKKIEITDITVNLIVLSNADKGVCVVKDGEFTIQNI